MRIDSKKYFAALDLSGPNSSFALLDTDKKKIITAKSIPLNNRNNFSFFNEFFSSLNALAVECDEIVEWYVGIGPGSFTGLRIASSFVSGVIFGKRDIKINAIPSALPIAAKLNSSPEDTIAVLYYASNSEILIYSAKNNGKAVVNERKPVLAGREALFSKLEDYSYVVYLRNRFISDVLPEQLNNKVTIYDVYPIELFFTDKFITADYSLEDLIYVR